MNINTACILADIAKTEETRKANERATPHPRHIGLSIAEGNFLDHMTRWGSDGYPIEKCGRTWQWREAFGIVGPPTVFRTKRAAFESVDRYLDVLLDKLAGRL